MQRKHKKFQLGVFGESGTGKTTYAAKYIVNAGPCRCCGGPKTVFIFDDEDEFTEILGVPQAETPEQLDAAVSTGWVLFSPHKMFPGNMEKALEFFCDFVMKIAEKIPGRKIIVIDELGLKCSGNSIPEPLQIDVQTGRRYGIDFVFMGQQLNELHNTVRMQLNELCLFRTSEENALKFAVSAFRFDAEELKSLPDFRWVCRNKFGGEARG